MRQLDGMPDRMHGSHRVRQATSAVQWWLLRCILRLRFSLPRSFGCCHACRAVRVLHKRDALLHASSCPHRLVACPLCVPAHSISAAEMVSHLEQQVTLQPRAAAEWIAQRWSGAGVG